MKRLCAYYDKTGGTCYPLDEHSRNVSKAIVRLFEARLRAKPRGLYAPVLDENLLEAARLAGLLHDLGKASLYYQERVWQGGPGGFQYHEYLSTLIITTAIENELRDEDEELSAILALSAAAIARHHVAMKSRHPTLLFHNLEKRDRQIMETRNKFQQEVYNAAQHLDPNTLDSAIGKDTLSQPVKNAIRRAMEEVKALSHEDITSTLKQYVRSQDLATKIYGGQGMEGLLTIGSGQRPRQEAVIGLLYRVAGALIVGDILVAGCERRPGEGPEKAYARSWAQELLPSKPLGKVCEEILGDA